MSVWHFKVIHFLEFIILLLPQHTSHSRNVRTRAFLITNLNSVWWTVHRFYISLRAESFNKHCAASRSLNGSVRQKTWMTHWPKRYKQPQYVIGMNLLFIYNQVNCCLWSVHYGISTMELLWYLYTWQL